MKKLLIVSAAFLMVTGIVSITWAHGPNGGGGFRSYGNSKPSLSKPSFSSRTQGHSHYGSRPGQQHRGQSRAFPRTRQFPGIGSGLIRNNPGSLQNEAGLSPLEKAYSRGVGVSPLRKALERKAPPVPSYPQPSTFPQSTPFFAPVPDPWFYYGNGNQLRQLGVVPTFPQASQDLE